MAKATPIGGGGGGGAGGRHCYGEENKYWLNGHQPAPSTEQLFDEVFVDIPDELKARDLGYYVVGLPFESYVELTSPVRKDAQGKPIMQGRLTVNKLDVYYKQSGGLEATVTASFGLSPDEYGRTTALRFDGRLLGYAINMAGFVPVTTGNVQVFIGRDSKDYVCKIGAITWRPLNITRVTWTGQWFLNHRFV